VGLQGSSISNFKALQRSCVEYEIPGMGVRVASVNVLVDTLQLVAVLSPTPCGEPPEQHL
jgi:hypothetical protein